MNSDQLRVGDAERDEVASALHEHFVRGRLTRDELDERLESALSARTVGDLRDVTRDLPGTELAARGGGASHRRHPRHPDLPRREHGMPGPLWDPYGGTRHRHLRHGGRPHRHPFTMMLFVPLVVAAAAGWWLFVPVFLFVLPAFAFAGVRHARRRHG